MGYTEKQANCDEWPAFLCPFCIIGCLDALLSHTNDIAAIFILDRVPVRIITNHNQRTAERGRINAFHLVAFMSSLANQPLAFQFQLRGSRISKSASAYANAQHHNKNPFQSNLLRRVINSTIGKKLKEINQFSR